MTKIATVKVQVWIGEFIPFSRVSLDLRHLLDPLIPPLNLIQQDMIAFWSQCQCYRQSRRLCLMTTDKEKISE